jgi:hypothetical protein
MGSFVRLDLDPLGYLAGTAKVQNETIELTTELLTAAPAYASGSSSAGTARAGTARDGAIAGPAAVRISSAEAQAGHQDGEDGD